MLLSPARWRKTSPARYYQQHYSGFGKTLAKLCSGIYIRLEVLYCRTEVVISNQGSIIHLKKHIRPLLWVPECKVKTKPINRHFNPLLICYVSWIRIEWIVFNLHAALFVIVLGPMWHLPNFKDFFYSKGSCEKVKIVTRHHCDSRKYHMDDAVACWAQSLLNNDANVGKRTGQEKLVLNDKYFILPTSVFVCVFVLIARWFTWIVH